MSKFQIIQRLLDPGIVAIIRADSSDQLVEACEALAAGGITAVEITVTTPNAMEVIRTVSTTMASRICVGAGTVLDEATARLAFLHGAEYIVTPVVRPDVIQACHRYGKPIFCGAFTPTEAFAAHEAGADFIKIFPAESLGLAYIKAIRAPLPQLNLVPTGGVDLKNCGDFIKAGCPAVAVGGSLVGKEILKARDWKKMTATARAFVAAVKKARLSSK